MRQIVLYYKMIPFYLKVGKKMIQKVINPQSLL